MADKAVTLICTAADLEAANALAAQFPGGAGTFSFPLTTTNGSFTATHYAGSGFVPADMADAMDVSLAPMVKVFPLSGGVTFWDHLAMCEPPLYPRAEV